VQGIKNGRSYCSDGLSHLIDYSVGGLGVGEKGAGGRSSVLAAASGKPLDVKVRAAALLAAEPDERIRQTPLDQKPYWHVERARVGKTNQVPVELIVNGQVVDKKLIAADGKVDDVAFQFTPSQSSWVAVRIFPSSHTNPVFVEVEGQPIRASRKSAQWCLDGVDVCWQKKAPAIRAEEKPAAEAAYEAARVAYRKILAESKVD
jgi:hypothetical protein